jgi:beta-lactamase class D
LSEIGGDGDITIVEGNMQINNKATIETSNNPDSTFDIVHDPSGFKRRMLQNEDRYTESLDVN